MKELVMIRHGETDLNRAKIFAGRVDCNLTAEGLQQAKDLWHGCEQQFDAYYCSPLKRTQQTLAALVPGVEPIIDERIIEIDLGEWENQPKHLIDAKQVAAYRIGQLTPPGGESPAEIDARVCDFVQSMFRKYQFDERVLVVTHNGVMRAIKRLFVPDYGEIMSKNLGTIVLRKENLEYFLSRSKK